MILSVYMNYELCCLGHSKGQKVIFIWTTTTKYYKHAYCLV